MKADFTRMTNFHRRIIHLTADPHTWLDLYDITTYDLWTTNYSEMIFVFCFFLLSFFLHVCTIRFVYMNTQYNTYNYNHNPKHSNTTLKKAYPGRISFIIYTPTLHTTSPNSTALFILKDVHFWENFTWMLLYIFLVKRIIKIINRYVT